MITSASRALEGPYTIASVPQAQKYTLECQNGTKWGDGAMVEERKLEFADE